MGILGALTNRDENPWWVHLMMTVLVAPFSEGESVGSALKYTIGLFGGGGLAAYLIFAGHTPLGPFSDRGVRLPAREVFLAALEWSPSWLLFLVVVPAVGTLLYRLFPKRTVYRAELAASWDFPAASWNYLPAQEPRVHQVRYDLLPVWSQILLGVLFGALTGLALVPSGIDAVMWGVWIGQLKAMFLPGL